VNDILNNATGVKPERVSSHPERAAYQETGATREEATRIETSTRRLTNPQFGEWASQNGFDMGDKAIGRSKADIAAGTHITREDVIKGILKQGTLKAGDIPASVDTYLKPKGSVGSAEANSDEFAKPGQPRVMRDSKGKPFIEDAKTGKWVPLTDDVANTQNVQAMLDQGFMPDQVMDMFAEGKPGDAPYQTSRNPFKRWWETSKEKMAAEDARDAAQQERVDQMNRLNKHLQANPNDINPPASAYDTGPKVPPRSKEWGPEPDAENLNPDLGAGTEVPLRDDMTDEEFEEMRQKLIDWFKENGGQEPTGNEGPVPRKDSEEFNKGAMIMRKPEGGFTPTTGAHGGKGPYLYENPFTGEWQSWEALWKGIHGEGDAGPAMRKK
jgi:hypothetical protein